MGNFNRNDRSSGPRRDFGGGGFNRDRQMHHAVCSNCGKDCEVPFAPTGSKPVYCRECFEQNGGDSRRSQDRGPRRDFNRNDSGPQKNEQLETIIRKLDKILNILTPSPVKEVKEAKKPKEVKSTIMLEELAIIAPKKPKAKKK